MTRAAALLADVRNAFVIADTAYDSGPLRDELHRRRCRVVIPSNPTRRRARRFDRRLYKQRHRVENFFQRLKRFRRIATRYDKRSTTFFAMVCFAAVLIWLL